MERKYDLDWIRVLATLAVFIYHCFMFFNVWPWHVKNNEIDPIYITAVALVMSSWLMPIFFAISGMNTFYALRKRTGNQFLRERLVRLGIPLTFGVFVLTPPQVYMERISHGQFTGSFLSWFPEYFDGVYLDIGGSGNFAFVGLHLWYLLLLLVFSIILLPLLLKGNRFINTKLEALHLLLLSIPLMILASFVDIVRLGGWDLVYYLSIFLYGYYLLTNASFRTVVVRLFPVTITLSIITSILVLCGYFLNFPEAGGISSVLYSSVRALNSWTWLLAIFAFGDKYLSKPNVLLNYGSRASMPFYVLHQPVIVFIGFYLADMNGSILVKLGILLITAFAIIMFLYHFVISRISILRVLFGMK